ncbi:MAG: RNA polymerase sigma factor [Kineothrix sp.]
MEKMGKATGMSASHPEDIEAVQKKIDEYSRMLYTIAFLQLRNNHDAEDVVQETFYQMIKNKKEFESPEHEKAWLIRVTLNGCRKVWRSAWYRHRGSMTEKGTSIESEAEDGMERDFLQRERNREILEAVMRLPVKYREVIHLFYYQQMSIKEIGYATGRKESTVTSQLTRGRELLRKKLREEYRYE